MPAATINASKKQAKKSQDALIRERRIDFELGVLRDLAESNLKDDNVAWAGARFKVLAAMLPVDLISLARASVRLESTPEAEAAVSKLVVRAGHGSRRSQLSVQIEEEILAAIEQLKANRG
jgi:hypothetical protein